MIAPYKWLCDYVDMDITPEDLMQKLIMTGSEVDGFRRLDEGLDHIVVGRIESIKKHPDADKLSVCNVFTGSETLQIVCGADNIYEGAHVPVALVGACLPGGLKISKSKLRGVFSFGMLCSGSELEIDDVPGADVDGIWIMPNDTEPGSELKEVLGLADTVFDIEVGANRPDCLSVLGIARECAAALERPLQMPKTDYTEKGGSISDYVNVAVQDSDICTRYVARAVTNVKIGPSPKWLADRLTSAGIRPISNIVDITNFVMLETGQPMHAFDHNNIRGGRIIVRRANKDETIVTLDDKQRTLSQDMLLICDAQGAIGIAGVMGGENSEIKNDTKTVIFESAHFSQGNVRRTSRALGLQTESAMRFSKGLDPVGCKTAMDRALHLVELLGAGDIVSGEIDIVSADLSPRQVRVKGAKVNAILGTDIDHQTMASLLRRVFIPTALENGTLVCDIPSFRGDISFGEDIAEEVARMYGYNNIPTTLMTGEIRRGSTSEEEGCTDRLRKLFCSLGCFECVTYSFGALSDIRKLGEERLCDAVKIINPLGDDQSMMRTSPVPDMLRVVSNNINKKVTDIRLFELGRVYMPNGNELPIERKYVCVALCGQEDFYSLKGIIENMAEDFGINDLSCLPDAAAYYHPGRKASFYAGGTKLGEAGEIAPDVSSAFGVEKRVYIAEIMLDALLSVSDDTKKYEPLPKFPAVVRDIALTVNADVPAGSLLDCIRQNAGPCFESVNLFDVYTDEKLGADKKSLAFSIVFRADNRTLLDEEANSARDDIVLAAQAAFDAKLRD